MNSVYVPVNVVLLFRRIVNVVSTLSISNQYYHYNQPNDVRPGIPNESSPTSSGSPTAKTAFSNALLNGLSKEEWPWWAVRSNWDKIALSENRLQTLGMIREEGRVLKSESISLPWVGRGWSWPSMFSSLQPNPGDPSNDPPPMNNNNKDKKEDRNSRFSLKPKKEPPKKFALPPELQDPKPAPPDIIHQLLANPALTDPVRTPRYPIVLCHGLYGFDTRGPSTFPSMRMHYWANVLKVLQGKIGAEVIVTSVPGTGSISARAERLNHQLHHRARGRGVNFLAHSMGGLDCRHLITHLKPSEFAPLSLTTIGTPHRGSPFMDWCADNIGIGKLRQQERDLAAARATADIKPLRESTTTSTKTTFTASESPSFSLSLSALPSSFTTLLLSIVDSPAYANLTSSYLNDEFNPNTPDDPNVKYFSVAGRLAGVNIWHPFWLPKMVLDGVEEKQRGALKKLWEEQGSKVVPGEIPLWANEREWGNDGLVTVQSAKWGEFLGIMEGCDHWEMRGARGIEFGVDLPAIPAIGLGGSGETVNGDGWGLNWGRLVGAWKKEESVQVAANSGKPLSDSSSSPSDSTPSTSHERSSARESERELARSKDDEIVKSSTDKLSFVFDWLIEQIPGKVLVSDQLAKASEKAHEAISASTGDVTQKVAVMREKVGEGLRDAVAYSNAHVGASGSKEEGKGQAEQVSEMKKRMEKEGRGRKQNELESKRDLERFYIALTRKMYDEGL